MNAFQMLRPRGADTAPAKVPKKRKTAQPITVKGTTRVMNVNGKLQAPLNPNAASIVIEGQAQGQASADKRSKLIRGTV